MERVYAGKRGRYEFITDHCRYTPNLSSCEIKPEKPEKNSWTRFEPIILCDISAVLYRMICQTTGSWSLCEFVIYL